MDSVGRRGDAQQRGAEVERHAVDGRGIGAAAELVQLLAAGHRKDADDGARLAGRGEQRAVVVEAYAAERRAVRLDDVDGLERDGVEDEDVAGRRGHVGRLGRRVRGPPGVGVLARLGQRVRDEAVLRRRRQGADGRRVRRRGYRVDEAHVANVVEVDFLLEDDGEALAVEAHRQDGRGERELAYYRSSL